MNIGYSYLYAVLNIIMSCLENLDKQIDELTNACFALGNSLITNHVKVVNYFF